MPIVGIKVLSSVNRFSIFVSKTAADLYFSVCASIIVLNDRLEANSMKPSPLFLDN